MAPKKSNRPTLDEYYGLEAQAYGHSRWMAKNQIATSERVIGLLESDILGSFEKMNYPTQIFFDLGIGTGYSSHLLLQKGVTIIGIDLSRDMLIQCPSHPLLHLIQADMRFLPFRNEQADHLISISAFNFIAEGAKTELEMKKLIKKVYNDIVSILKSKARVIIEFYPTKLQEKLFLKVVKHFSFKGGMIIDDPQTRKEKKYLVLLKL